jgi:hypothetical protein
MEHLTRLIRQRFNIPLWYNITVSRTDDNDFWLEEGGQCKFISTHDQIEGMRLPLAFRMDFLDRTYFSGEIRFQPEATQLGLFEELAEEWVIELPGPVKCSFCHVIPCDPNKKVTIIFPLPCLIK